MNRRQSRRALLATVPAVLGAGCVDTLVGGQGNDGPDYDSCPEDLDVIEEELCGLIEADDREEYASEPHIHYDEGEVFVSLLLEDGAELPTDTYGFDIDEEYSRIFTAFMDIDQVIPLAKEENVLLITLRYLATLPKDESHISPGLRRLLSADDRGEFAQRSNMLWFEGGSVESIVHMEGEEELDMEAHHIDDYFYDGSAYLAMVKVDYLVPLARHEKVIKVSEMRPPDDD